MGQRLPTFLSLILLATADTPVRAESQRDLTPPVHNVLRVFATYVTRPADELLDRLRPAPLDSAARARILASLPSHGAVRPGSGEIEKMQLAESIIANEGRGGSVSLVLIDVAPAFVGLYERAVILTSIRALPLLSREGLAALVAHELAHEYVWSDYQAATLRRDHAQVRELELRCDGLAVLILRRAGVDAEHLASAVKALTWFNRVRRYTADQENYVSVEERVAFIRAVDALPWRIDDPTRVARQAEPPH